MSLGTKIYTWLNGNLVGSDDLGNKYYCNSKNFKDTNAKDGLFLMEKLKHLTSRLIGMHGYISLLISLLLIIRINISGKKIINQI